jgi:hypothetical protein
VLQLLDNFGDGIIGLGVEEDIVYVDYSNHLLPDKQTGVFIRLGQATTSEI